MPACLQARVVCKCCAQVSAKQTRLQKYAQARQISRQRTPNGEACLSQIICNTGNKMHAARTSANQRDEGSTRADKSALTTLMTIVRSLQELPITVK